VDDDVLEGFNLLADAVFEEIEIGGAEIRNWDAAAGREDVDPDQVGAPAEPGKLVLRLLCRENERTREQERGDKACGTTRRRHWGHPPALAHTVYGFSGSRVLGFSGSWVLRFLGSWVLGAY
jgi:hypothetical protein